jgi:hypothetical protein
MKSLRFLPLVAALPTAILPAAAITVPAAAQSPRTARGDGRIIVAPAPVAIDAGQAYKAGIRSIPGRRLTLYTDVPSSPEVDELPAVFEAAVPQWAAYFGVEKTLAADWHVDGFLMRDAEKFKKAGLIPGHLPKFNNGFAIGTNVWLFDQPNAYYRRHLLLHEGTHSFMHTQLGHCGPPWYMEGIAEIFGTHRIVDGKLETRYIPRNRDEVPDLGRVKLIHDAIAAGRRMTLAEIMNYSAQAHLENEPYAWCWAACAWLDGHPRYQVRFRRMFKHVNEPTRFNDEFKKLFLTDMATMAREWSVFADGLEYAFDVPRTAIDFRPGRPLSSPGTSVTVAADKGWQSSGVRLEEGKTYTLAASGRYRIAQSTDSTGAVKPWPCEPGGVTIRYYHGRPLGVLLASIEPDSLPVGTPPPMLTPEVVGLGTTLTAPRTGTLYFRVNDSYGELGDNSGSLTVTVTPPP